MHYQYDHFVEERLVKCCKAITDTIHQNKLLLFEKTENPASNKTKKSNFSTKDCNLFARLSIACQTREGNLQEFFKHENHASPPSLSQAGKMPSGQKPELVQLLDASTTVKCPDVDVMMLLKLSTCYHLKSFKTFIFKDYVTSIFFNYVIKQAQNVNRIEQF